jgi:antitoxin PrlF
MTAHKRTEQYEGTVVQVGNSRGMRLPAGFFAAHPEFREGKVKVTVVADGQVLVSAASSGRASRGGDEADPVMEAFLRFVEREMIEHPEQIVPADADQLRRIGKLVEGVETE